MKDPIQHWAFGPCGDGALLAPVLRFVSCERCKKALDDARRRWLDAPRPQPDKGPSPEQIALKADIARLRQLMHRLQDAEAGRCAEPPFAIGETCPRCAKGAMRADEDQLRCSAACGFEAGSHG